MPYIGNNLATQFQAFATQTITGDGSTSYTLDRAVANGKELLVYINNVKQEEGSGKSYEASGTTITFSEAVASGDSCYLVYMGSATQTVTPPDASIVSGMIANSELVVPNDLKVTGNVTFNDDSADKDFRVESNGNANMLVVDGGNDVMAIGRAVVTSATLAIQNKDDTNNNALDIYNDNGNRNISIQQDTSGNGKFIVQNNAGNNMHRFDADGAIYRIGNESPATNGHIRMADSGGYTMDWMGTGTRAYVFRGATSGGNYTTTFDNPGGGVHNLTIDGALSKGSGSFKIDHPLESKRDTNWLVHSFLEGPQADLIYRGSVKLSSGSATVDIDTASGMTSGTFEALCANVQCFTSNETGWTAIKGSVSGKTLTITAQDNSCTDTISWMVVGERNDTHMKKADWTDTDGRVIVEPTRDAPPKEETPREGRE